MVYDFESLPSLLPLFAKAVTIGRAHRGDALPRAAARLTPQQIDRAHLAAYQRVCGFAVSDELPATYLHVIAFPLSVDLMTRGDFPLPLLGLVHVANEVSVLRPASAGERFAVEVHTEKLRPHRAGVQFDVVATARVLDEPVWHSRSIYLRRQHNPHSAAAAEGAEAARRAASVALQRPGVLLRVPRDAGRRYAAVSGDRNPIHLHPLSARALGFPRAIAHGMWLKARTLATLQGRLAGSYRAQIEFQSPAFLPSTVRIVAAADGDGWRLDMRNARSGKPHLDGTVSGTAR